MCRDQGPGRAAEGSQFLLPEKTSGALEEQRRTENHENKSPKRILRGGPEALTLAILPWGKPQHSRGRLGV